MRTLFAFVLTLPLGAGNRAAAAPPSPYLDYGLKAKAVESKCAASLEKAQGRLKELAEIPDARRDFKNTPWALDLVQDDINAETASATFLKYVSTDEAIRDAAHQCETKVSKFFVDLYTREDLYKAVKAYAAGREPLQGEDKKLLEKTLLDFKRNGLELPPPERARVRLLKKLLVDLELTFGKNLNEVKDFLPVTKEELEGLPEDYKGRLEKLPEGRFKVTLDYPDYFPFMENAKSADARRRLEALYLNRGYPDNVPLLEEALRLRHRVASLLGYPDHAHYVLDDRMAKDPQRVQRFLSSLRKKLTQKGHPELATLLELKKRDEPSAERLNAYDWLYYHNQLKKERYAIDDEKVKEYFPLQTVTAGMFAVYQKLLGVSYREVTPPEGWHSDVKLYEVTDAQTGERFGHFYMDLFPREGKYKHAAAFTLVGGRKEPEGGYRTAVASIVANFNKPTEQAPSLLKHSEVETYFHEFGHIMHQVLTRARYPRFAGSRTAQDFVEAPSQMLENWVWNAEVLKSLSGHYQDGSRKLPDDLLKRMLEAKNLDSGIRYLRQVFYASVDLEYHISDSVDSTEVYRRLFDRITLLPMSREVHPQASFGHLMGGYDAAYYGYLWSEVFAQDMFAKFEREGVMSGEVGREYRRLILEPGGGQDEAGQLRRFLGREPNDAAFLRNIGLQAALLP